MQQKALRIAHDNKLGFDFDEGMLQASRSKFAKHSNVFCHQVKLGPNAKRRSAKHSVDLTASRQPLTEESSAAESASASMPVTSTAKRKPPCTTHLTDGMDVVQTALLTHHGIDVDAITLVFVDVGGTMNLTKLWPLLSLIRGAFLKVSSKLVFYNHTTML
jgi:hypothetical protein